MKNNLKKKIYEFLLNERDIGSEREYKEAAKEAAKEVVKKTEETSKTAQQTTDPDKPIGAGEPDKPIGKGEPESAPQSRKKSYSYETAAGDSVPYHTNSNLVKQIQQKLVDISGEYLKILQVGDPRYGGTQSFWKQAVDGNYGPRTDIALIAFYDVEKKVKRNPQQEITQEDLKQVSSVNSSNSKITPAKAKDAASNASESSTAAEKKEKVEESYSYRKDLLQSTKNRNKELEKIVFERLVKNAN